MKKRIICGLLLSFLIIGGNIWAQKVSIDEAQQRAANFFSKSSLSANGQKKAPRKAPRMVAAVNNDAFYIFNDEANGGFVIVSGEERTPDILGYSDSGSFDPQNVPTNMQAWLDGYKEQVKAVAASSVKVSESTTYVSRKPIIPLLNTEWNQDEPYNLLCPIEDGKQCYTGCVATAMAQIMNFWQYPSQTTSTIPNRVDSRLNFSHPDIAAGTAIDWQNMPYSLADYKIEAKRKAVSELMLYCGMGAQMDYGSKQSGAYTYNALSALVNYFGYSSKSKYIRRVVLQTYSYEDWLYVIYNELRQGHPVQYEGVSSTSAHAFVCDGYASEDYYHINWGWGGNCDGYFRMEVMKPDWRGIGGGDGDDGYASNQGALIGVVPSGHQDPLAPLAVRSIKVGKNQYQRSSVTNDFTSVVITPKLFVTTSESADYSIVLYQDGQQKQQLYNNTLTEDVGQYVNNDISFSFGGGLADGDYMIKVLCRRAGESEWQQCLDGNEVYVKATVSGTKLTLQPTDFNLPQQTIKLTCTQSPVITETEGVFSGVYLYNATFTLRNDGDDYAGPLCILDTDGNMIKGVNVAISAGETKTVVVENFAGNENLGWEGKSLHLVSFLDQTQIQGSDFTVCPYPHLKATYDVPVLLNAEHYYGTKLVYDNKISGTLIVEYPSIDGFGPVASGKFQLIIGPSYLDPYGKIEFDLNLKPGEKKEIPFSFDKNNSIHLDYGVIGLFVGNTDSHDRAQFYDKDGEGEWFIVTGTANPTIYTIKATANPTNGGTVTGARDYPDIATVTLKAIPNDGYEFTNWTENNVVVCTEATYEFLATANHTLVANFTKNGGTDPQPDPQAPFVYGTAYYLYNVAADMYLCGSNSYDTQASVGEAGADLLFEDKANGQTYYVNGVQAAAYAIDTRFYNSDTDHYLGMVDNNTAAYIDQPSRTWFFVPQEDGTYLMSSDSEGHYLCYTNGKTALGFTTDATNNNAKWRVLTVEDILARAVNATQDQPISLSSLISYADFGRNGKMRYQVWNGDIARGGSGDNWCAEKFNCTYDVYQTLTGLPHGAYVVRCQGFYREGADENYSPAPAVQLRQNGEEHLYAKLYANEESQPLHSIFDGASENSTNGVNTVLGWIPNSMSDAANRLRSYQYRNDDPYRNTLKVNVTDGTLRLGIKKSQAVYRDWTIFDTFRLYYFGTTPWNDTVTGVQRVMGDSGLMDVYTVGGQIVRHQVATLKGLAKGVYIVNGKKIVVK